MRLLLDPIRRRSCVHIGAGMSQHLNQKTQIVNRQRANTNFLYPVFLSVWSAVCLSVRLSVGPPLPVSLCVRSSIRLNVRPLVCLSLSVCLSVCLRLLVCLSTPHFLPVWAYIARPPPTPTSKHLWGSWCSLWMNSPSHGASSQPQRPKADCKAKT